MKLRPGSFAVAAALVTGGVYLLCTIALILAPRATIAYFSTMLHWNLAMLIAPVTWGGALLGTVCLGIGASLIAATFAWLYNRLPQAGTK